MTDELRYKVVIRKAVGLMVVEKKCSKEISMIKNSNEIRYLQHKSAELRHMLVDLVNEVGSSHIGGPLSACDVITALFYKFMNYSVLKADDPNRDRFILSKGHNGDLLYCVFADLGFYSFDELIKEFKKDGGRWGEHPNRVYNPGFECSTGSLGHGLPIAAGMAMASKLDKRKNRIYCLTGDGELQEGSNWETIMCAAHHRYDNLVLIVDMNGAQGTHLVSDLCDDKNVEQRMEDFGWKVYSVQDGNDMIQLYETLSRLPYPEQQSQPICIILHTVKGRGIDFMEKDPANCHAAGFKGEQLEKAHNSIDRWLEEEKKKLEIAWEEK